MVVGPGSAEMLGACVSTTLMVWLAVLLLPQWSVAVQVRVTLLACGQAPGVVTSAKVRVGLGSHASVAVGVANDGVAGHSMVVGPGSAEMLGACVSTTLMVWLAVLLLPQWSLAVQVRVTLLACGQAPGVVTSAKVRVGLGSHASVAVGVANDGVAGHSMVVGPGSVEIPGAVVSTTLMVWLAVLLLPQWSVAVQVRVTLLACGQEPGVVTSAKVRVGLGSHASLAVGVANDGVAGHSMVVGPGSAEMLGAVVCTTLMVWLAVLLLPQWSVAVQVRVTLLACGQDPGVVTSANVSVGLGSHASFSVRIRKPARAALLPFTALCRAEITGAVVSTTWMTWLAVLLLPQWSVAVQVRVTLESCGQLPAVVTSAKVSVGLGSQASVAVGVAKDGVAGHWIVVGPGSAEITGAVVSTTWMVWLAVELLPQ